MNFRMHRYILGRLCEVFSGLLLLPLLVALLYREGQTIVFPYLTTGLIALACGVLLAWKKPERRKLYRRDGLIIVAVAWIFFALMGALPLLMTREVPSLIDGFFEMASGFTTTGSTIFTDVEALSHATLFWRSLAHLVGGMGVLVFALAIIPGIGAESTQLMKAEVPGPTFGKIKSSTRESARVLYLIYLGMTAILVLLLLFGGMDLFDALIHAFGAAGTGGFSNKNLSIGTFHSSYIEIVLALGMLAFGVNFNLYYYFLLTKGKKWPRSEELNWYLAIVALTTLGVGVNILPQYLQRGESWLTALKDSFFNVSSIITTTGFGTADFVEWPLFSHLVLLLLMFCGACAGSTGGGLKVARIVIGSKTAVNGAHQSWDPKRTLPLRFDGEVMEHSALRKVFAYYFVYIGLFLVFMFPVSLDCGNFELAFSAVAATYNNIGPGLALIGPRGNYAFFSPFSKFVLSLAMITGRLELYPMLALCTLPSAAAAERHLRQLRHRK